MDCNNRNYYAAPNFTGQNFIGQNFTGQNFSADAFFYAEEVWFVAGTWNPCRKGFGYEFRSCSYSHCFSYTNRTSGSGKSNHRCS